MQEYQVYNPAGTLLSSAKISLEGGDRLFDWQWIWYDGQYMIGMLYDEQGWRALDPQTGLLIQTQETKVKCSIRPVGNNSQSHPFYGVNELWLCAVRDATQ